jgi:hypothetical protein
MDNVGRIRTLRRILERRNLGKVSKGKGPRKVAGRAIGCCQGARVEKVTLLRVLRVQRVWGDWGLCGAVIHATRPSSMLQRTAARADCVEKLRFRVRLTTFLAVQGNKILVARGSAKLAFRRSCISSLHFKNDFI